MKLRLYQPQAIWELGKRANQEDAIFPALGEATAQDRLFILCDGMGGHEKGEVASRTVSQTMAEYLDANASADEVVGGSALLAALEATYHKLDALDDGAARKMGTTLCLLLFHRGGVTAMHIGDSRIYHVRPSENRIMYQSKDHSLVYDLYQAGEITYEEMLASPQKNIITRAVFPGEELRAKPAIVHIADVKPGDYFYVCSDGMLEQMDNGELCGLLSGKGSDEEKRNRLVELTADNADNHSAYIVHVEAVEAEPGDENAANDEQTSRDNALNLRLRDKLMAAVAQEDTQKTDDDSDVTVAEPAKKKPHGRKGLWGIPVVVVIAAVALAIVKPRLGGGEKPGPKMTQIKGPTGKAKADSGANKLDSGKAAAVKNKQQQEEAKKK